MGPTGEWAFKGEGNANIVFAYTGSYPLLVRLAGGGKGSPPPSAARALCAAERSHAAAHHLCPRRCPVGWQGAAAA
jgi:hypothetical protein